VNTCNPGREAPNLGVLVFESEAERRDVIAAIERHMRTTADALSLPLIRVRPALRVAGEQTVQHLGRVLSRLGVPQ
jgi:hypothetical protein